MRIYLGIVVLGTPFCLFAARSRGNDPGNGLWAMLVLFSLLGLVWGSFFLSQKIIALLDKKRLAALAEYDCQMGKYRDYVIAECSKVLGKRFSSFAEIYIHLSILRKALRSELEKEFDEKMQRLAQREDDLAQKDAAIAQRENLINTKCLKFPPLARCLAKFEEYKLLQAAWDLETKKRPAMASARKVREAVRDAKDYILKFEAAKILIDNYETLFPWITEYREFDIDEILASSDDTDDDESEDPVRRYMTPSDYSNLSPAERNQMALERFLAGKKSNWMIGRMYERYVGYLYEQKGYHVSYFGATAGVEDLGRDIIAVKGYQHLIIQCKYWKKERTIHENVICQLFGTTIRYRFDHTEKDLFGEKYDVHAILITSASCSEMARDFAKYLNVELIEIEGLADYPMIKCNIGSEGEKIYHLPFDQMYDRVVIEPSKGEFYAKTCHEAEEHGFRRAFRWRGA